MAGAPRQVCDGHKDFDDGLLDVYRGRFSKKLANDGRLRGQFPKECETPVLEGLGICVDKEGVDKVVSDQPTVGLFN